MREYPLNPDTPPVIAGDYLTEHGWTLADVLEWFAGSPSGHIFCSIHDDHMAHDGCTACQAFPPFALPPAEYGRDALAAFIMAGGATHPRHVEWAEVVRMEKINWLDITMNRAGDSSQRYERDKATVDLALKRRILRLFSGPVEEGGVRIVRQCEERGMPLFLRLGGMVDGSERLKWLTARGFVPFNGEFRFDADKTGPGLLQFPLIPDGQGHCFVRQELTPEQLLPVALPLGDFVPSDEDRVLYGNPAAPIPHGIVDGRTSR